MGKVNFVKTIGCLGLLLGIAIGSPKVWPEEARKIDLSGLPDLVSTTPPKPTVPSGSAVKGAATPADDPFFVLCYHRFLLRPDEKDREAQAEYQMPLD